ncbi:hypothetical protein DUNSADRAFT_7314 [Dunaliella salina]|uniref:Uncharacterized protein n=1 Tax=Dunaliella salina TaxID=3046 RepID=A0ABQ7GLH9_DUNSA|nr:hypothetical protein DUNSADRAFT_7314 [Dunaliella salina]|eukprot:KAF5835474.1 hypothetical protein DUNSADRAFT_7314 [Dunaliella salina]
MHSMIAQRKEQAQRTTGSSGGYHYTPSFIHSIMRDARAAILKQQLQEQPLPEAKSFSMPRGGFTDVGLHTGTLPPNTAWPLVREALKVLLLQANLCGYSSSSLFHSSSSSSSSSSSNLSLSSSIHQAAQQLDPTSLYQHALAFFDLWLLEGRSELLQPRSCSPAALDICMQMLQSAAHKAAQLAEAGFTMQSIEEVCVQVRQHLDSVAAARAQTIAQQFELPSCGSSSSSSNGSNSSSSSSSSSNSSNTINTKNATTSKFSSPSAPSHSLADEQVHYQLPRGTLPPANPPYAQEGGLGAARARAKANLGSLPLLPLRSSPLRILEWLQMPIFVQGSGELSMLLRLQSIERELFSRGAAGLQHQPLSQPEVAALRQVVDVYRTLLYSFQQTTASKAFMAVVLRSKLVLVVWIAYCLAHSAACSSHPLAAQYGVSLQWGDLRHLVLPSKVALDAACSVCAYLAAYTKPGTELFSLRSSTATFEFGRQYADGCSTMHGIWADQQADASIRQEAHWQRVQRKQRLAASLRQQEKEQEECIRGIARDLHAAEGNLNYLKLVHRSTSDKQRHANSIRSRKVLAESTLSSIRSQREAAEKAPPAVIQPLPSSRHLALPWVFHLHMPPMLRHLSHLSFLSAQVLLPCSEQRKLHNVNISTPTCPTNLQKHYNQQQLDSTFHSAPKRHVGVVECVELWSGNKVPGAKDVGPKHVDSFYSRFATPIS